MLLNNMLQIQVGKHTGIMTPLLHATSVEKSLKVFNVLLNIFINHVNSKSVSKQHGASIEL